MRRVLLAATIGLTACHTPPPPAVQRSAFVFFETDGSECVWSTLDPPDTVTARVRFPRPCGGVQVLWSARGREALVTFAKDPQVMLRSRLDELEAWWLVDLATWRIRVVEPSPTSLPAASIDFRRDGRLTIETHNLLPATIGERLKRSFGSHGPDKWGGFVESDGKWHEARLDDEDPRPGEQIFLRESSSLVLYGDGRGATSHREVPLDGWATPVPAEPWSPGRVVLMRFGDRTLHGPEPVGFPLVADDMALDVDGVTIELGHETLVPFAEGDWLLVHELFGPRRSRLYDTRTGALVWQSESATVTVRWPDPYTESK